MALKVGGSTVVNNSLQLQNIASLDSTTEATISSVASGVPESASMTSFPVGTYSTQFCDSNSANGFTNSSSHFDTITASASTPVRLIYGGYSYDYVQYGTWAYMGRIYSNNTALVCRVA